MSIVQPITIKNIYLFLCIFLAQLNNSPDLWFVSEREQVLKTHRYSSFILCGDWLELRRMVTNLNLTDEGTKLTGAKRWFTIRLAQLNSSLTCLIG